MRIIKKIVIIILALYFGVALIVPLFFEGKIAEIVKKEVNKMLVAELNFEDLDLSLLRHFPNASLELKDLTLIGQEPFQGDTILSSERISVVVNPFSLLTGGGFNVKKVLLNEPSINAQKLANGQVNWDVMRPSKEEDNPTKASEEDTEPSAFKMKVKDFLISDASIRYKDDSLGVQFSTRPLNLSLSGDLSAKETSLDLNLSLGATSLYTGGVPMLSKAEIELDAEIDANLEEQYFTFKQNSFSVNAIEMTWEGWVDLNEDAVQMDLKASCDKVLFKDVLSMIPAFYTRNFRDLTARGELSLIMWAKGEMRGHTLPEFQLLTKVKDGSFQYSDLPKAVTDINLDLEVKNPGKTMDFTEVNLSKFGLQMAGNTLSANFYAHNLATDPIFRAMVKGDLNLNAIKEVYPLDKNTKIGGNISADVRLAGHQSHITQQRYEALSGGGNFTIEGLELENPGIPSIHIKRLAANINPKTMTLGDFQATFGESDVNANGQLNGYLGYLLHGDKLQGRLYVQSTFMNLNEWMKEQSQSQPKEEVKAETAPQTPSTVIEVPKNLDLSLSTHLGKILFQKMVITNVGGEMKIKGGTLSLNNLGLEIFDGKAKASGFYSTAQNVANPKLDLKASFQNATFEKTFEELELAQKLVPIFAKTGGHYSMEMALNTSLLPTMEVDFKTLQAEGKISSKEIKVQNIKAFEVLSKLLKEESLKNIQAKDIDIRFKVKDGRVTTQPFDLKMGKTNINLQGSTGLDQTIDYVARVSLPAGTSKIVKTIPVKIVGTFSSPKITLGVQEAAEDALKEVVKDKLGDKLGGKLDGLLPSKDKEERAQQIRQRAETAGKKLIDVANQQRQSLIEKAADKSRLAQIGAKAAGDKLVAEAEKQADKLKKDAEEKIKALEKEQ